MTAEKINTRLHAIVKKIFGECDGPYCDPVIDLELYEEMQDTLKECDEYFKRLLPNKKHMTESEWLSRYDATKDKFKWFMDKYFEGMFQHLELLRKDRLWQHMVTVLNYVWFQLPDDKFNIVQNPDGWREFLNLLEDLPETEKTE